MAARDAALAARDAAQSAGGSRGDHPSSAGSPEKTNWKPPPWEQTGSLPARPPPPPSSPRVDFSECTCPPRTRPVPVCAPGEAFLRCWNCMKPYKQDLLANAAAWHATYLQDYSAKAVTASDFGGTSQSTDGSRQGAQQDKIDIWCSCETGGTQQRFAASPAKANWKPPPCERTGSLPARPPPPPSYAPTQPTPPPPKAPPQVTDLRVELTNTNPLSHTSSRKESCSGPASDTAQ